MKFTNNLKLFNESASYRNINLMLSNFLLLNDLLELQLKGQVSTQKLQTLMVLINKNKMAGLVFGYTLQLYKTLCCFLFKGLTDIFGIDNINNMLKIFNTKIIARFSIIYTLTSFLKNKRLSILNIIDTPTTVTSIESVFCGSNWVEREVWDMFGIFFNKHKNLRRILTDYGFSGFPLRKDFPVTGYFEVRYDEEIKTVIYDKVTLAQENRTYDLPTPWIGYNA